ncbi:hypothetical protein SSTU70S_04692 [Stutzerimonas stutzeri]
MPTGIADFFKQVLASGPAGKKARPPIFETPFDNLHLITATAELADLQPKLEAKHKINKLRKLLDNLADDYDALAASAAGARAVARDGQHSLAALTGAQGRGGAFRAGRCARLPLPRCCSRPPRQPRASRPRRPAAVGRASCVWRPVRWRA